MKKKRLSVKKIVHNTINNYLLDKKILKTYNIFKKNIANKKFGKIIAGAISGGPDSLALAFLMKVYSLENSLKLKFIHINHKLRLNSTKEAVKLKKNMNTFNAKIIIINWNGKKPTSNIQAIARKNRYKLIFEYSIKNKVDSVFFAHNKNDLVENFLIRIMRGSGLSGFVSFNSISNRYENDLNIFRPLLNINKEDLIYISKKVFKNYLNDPSNENIKFKRVRVRKILNNLNDEGFNLEKIILTINNLTSSNQAIKYYTEENIKLNSSNLSKNSIIVNNDFFNKPDDVVIRSITTIIKKVNKKYYAPRGKQIINLVISLKSSKIKKLTLSGCVIEKINSSVIFYPEITKKSPKKYNLPLV